MRYRRKKNQDEKSYLVLFACSLSRALHLELLLNLETVEVLRSFETIHCAPRSADKDILRQRQNVCCCGQVAGESNERRTVA